MEWRCWNNDPPEPGAMVATAYRFGGKWIYDYAEYDPEFGWFNYGCGVDRVTHWAVVNPPLDMTARNP